MSRLRWFRSAGLAQAFAVRSQALMERIAGFFRTEAALIGLLSVVALAAYGYELFNLHLTIDEEIHAQANQAKAWIEQGRWGMFLLSRFLFPQPVVPFAPLFVALAFHLFAIVLLFRAWGIPVGFPRMVAGAVAMAYPVMAYIYVFSTINFGIGIGLFLVALTVFLFSRVSLLARVSAVLPAALALSIYQGLAIALGVGLVIKLIADVLVVGRREIDWGGMGMVVLIMAFAAGLYHVGQSLAFALSGLDPAYISGFYDVDFLRQQPAEVFGRLWRLLLDIYGGSTSIFGTSVALLPVILVLMVGSLAQRLIFAKASLPAKLVLIGLLIGVLLLPVSLGLVMRGAIPLRALVSMPIVVAGLLAIGASGQGSLFRLLSGVMVTFGVLQFVTSTNTLFASSALALESDRLTASRILERIEVAKYESGEAAVKYLEVVGYPEHSPTRIRPKSEVIGASFFEWEEGNVYRILYFLSTLADHGLHGLPSSKRGEIMAATEPMPFWPEYGSVQVVGDTVVVKFGPYSRTQLGRMSNAH